MSYIKLLDREREQGFLLRTNSMPNDKKIVYTRTNQLALPLLFKLHLDLFIKVDIMGNYNE